MMHRRPKKTRPSDINRRNVNQDKCITKIEGAPADYFIPSTPEGNEKYLYVNPMTISQQ
jgi:hypothetical protein